MESICGDVDDGVDYLNPGCYDRTEQAALFVLKARHIHKISQTAMNDLLSDVSEMIEDRVKYLEKRVCQSLQCSSSSTVLEAFHHPAVHFVDYIHNISNGSISLSNLDYWYITYYNPSDPPL